MPIIMERRSVHIIRRDATVAMDLEIILRDGCSYYCSMQY